MDDSKHKVTLYLSPELHRQLKIRAAVEEQPMSVLAERALRFLLEHPEAVEATYGRAHRVYDCPECRSALVMRSDALEKLPRSSAVLTDAQLVDPNAKDSELSLVG